MALSPSLLWLLLCLALCPPAPLLPSSHLSPSSFYSSLLSPSPSSSSSYLSVASAARAYVPPSPPSSSSSSSSTIDNSVNLKSAKQSNSNSNSNSNNNNRNNDYNYKRRIQSDTSSSSSSSSTTTATTTATTTSTTSTTTTAAASASSASMFPPPSLRVPISSIVMFNHYTFSKPLPDPDPLYNTSLNFIMQISVTLPLDKSVLSVAAQVCPTLSNEVNRLQCLFNIMNNVKILRSILTETTMDHIARGMPIISKYYPKEHSTLDLFERRNDSDVLEYMKMSVSKALASIYDPFLHFNSFYVNEINHKTQRDIPLWADIEIGEIWNNVEVPEDVSMEAVRQLNIAEVCMIGKLSIRSILTLMTMGSHLRVRYYIDSPSYSDIYKLGALFTSFHLHIEVRLFRLAQLTSLKVCDVIHIVGGDRKWIEIARNVLHKDLVHKQEKGETWSNIFPYSSNNKKLLVWERDYIDRSGPASALADINVRKNFKNRKIEHRLGNLNMSRTADKIDENLLIANYISSAEYLDAILTECEENPESLRCKNYRQMISSLLNDLNDNQEITNCLNNGASSCEIIEKEAYPTIQWLMNNTWQSRSRFCAVRDTEGYFVHNLCMDDFVHRVQDTRDRANFLTQVAVGELWLNEQPNSFEMDHSKIKAENKHVVPFIGFGLGSKNVEAELQSSQSEYWEGMGLSSEQLLKQIESRINENQIATPSDNKSNVVLVVTYTIRVFRENAFGLQQALRQAGYEHTVLMPILNLKSYYYLKAYWDMYFGKSDYKLIQIAIAPHEEQFLFPNYVVIQMEQVWSPYFTDVYPRFRHILANAKSIWTFSSKLKQDMLQLGHSNVHEIPVFTDGERSLRVYNLYKDKMKELMEDIESESPQWKQTNDYKFYASDVFMFGSHSTRRGDFFYSLRDLSPLPYDMCATNFNPIADKEPIRNKILSDFNKANGKSMDEYQALLMGADWCPNSFIWMHLSCTIGGFDVAIVDDERDKAVMRAKVIVNIHTDPDSSLEVHRINYLLSLGKCIISERSLNDPDLDKEYEDVVVFIRAGASAEEAGLVMHWLLSDDQYRTEMERRAFDRYYNVIHKQIEPLAVAMADAVEKSSSWII